jgi:small subunit ribosomal protein S1
VTVRRGAAVDGLEQVEVLDDAAGLQREVLADELRDALLVDARGAEVQLADDVVAYLRASEISRDRVEDARNVLKEGDEVNALIINVDRKTRSIQLSIKAKDNADNQEAMQRLSQSNERESTGTTSLGALLRAKLDNQGNS